MANVVRHYSNGEITVVWEPGRCIHSGVCFAGLPQVFDPRKRPWVNIGGASSKAIAAQVGQCPSGALRLAPAVVVNGAPVTESAPKTSTIEARPNGPYAVRGPATVTRPDGTVDQHPDGCLLCRCGQSANKPYCDGSHARTGFRG